MSSRVDSGPPTMSEHQVSVPGATVVYDVHGELADGVTPLLLVGSPMDASGFGTLASHFPDRVVVTVDPRNTGRSTPDDPSAAVTDREHAEDLHAVITDLGARPVDLFGSSGGAANALALVAAHPDDVRILVAHEPPVAGALPDREQVKAVTDDMLATYDKRGAGPAMAKFISFVMHRGPVTPAYLEQPEPDPAMFGMSAEDDGSRNDPLMANMRGGVVDAVPDVAAITAAATRWSSGSARSPRPVPPRARWPGARPTPSPPCSGWSRSSSRVATAASWVVSSARPASPRSSPRRLREVLEG